MRPRIADIVALAAEASSLTVADICGERRHRHIMRVRMACYLIARETGASFPEIGRAMSRDHSTVIHGELIARDLVASNPDYAAFVDKLRKAARTAEPFVADRINRFGNRPLRMAVSVSYRMPLAGVRPQLEVVSPAQPVPTPPLTEDEKEDERIRAHLAAARESSDALRDAIFAARKAA